MDKATATATTTVSHNGINSFASRFLRNIFPTQSDSVPQQFSIRFPSARKNAH